MTPFGERCRALRAQKKVSLRTMAAALEISPAYQGARSNLDRLLAEHPGIKIPAAGLKLE